MRGNVVAILLAACGSAVLLAQSAPTRLQDVKTIYVSPFEGQDTALASMVRDKLITYLAKSHGVSVVESEDTADAILIGSYTIQAAPTPYGHTRYHAQGAMRLANKDGLVLWADEASSSPVARSATSSFADNVARKLVQALSAEAPKK